MFVISFKSNYYGLSYPFTMKLNRFFRYCLKELVWYRAEKDAKTNMRFGFNAPTLDQQILIWIRNRKQTEISWITTEQCSNIGSPMKTREVQVLLITLFKHLTILLI